MSSKRSKEITASELRHSFVLFILLFAFWVILSGHLDLKHLSIGFVSAVVITIITRPLMHMSSTSEPQKTYFAFDFPYFRYIAYWPWLLWQIVKANIEIALVILNPNLPINPQIITFRKKMSNPHAHVVLANSITLTPGTVTVDVKDDLYLVHALTDSAAKGLVPEDGEAEMLTKVSSVFGEECARTGSEVSA